MLLGSETALLELIVTELVTFIMCNFLARKYQISGLKNAIKSKSIKNQCFCN